MKPLNWRLLLVMLLIVGACVPLVLPVYVWAGNITEADFYGVITISNNGTAATDVSTTANISTQALIDGGYIDADATNIVMHNTSGADVAFMPGLAGSPWAMYVPSMGASSYLSYLFYTGNVSGGKLRYFPDADGMTTTDDPSLELAANFSVELEGFTPGGTNGALLYKDSAILAAGLSGGNVTAMLPVVYTDPTGWVDPDAAWTNEGNAINNPATGADIAVAAPASGWSSFIEYTHAGVANCVAVQIYAESDADWTAIDVDAYYAGGWHDLYQGSYSNLAYEVYYLPSLQTVTAMRARFYNSNAAPQTELIILRVVDFVTGTRIVSAAATADDHIVRVAADGVDLKLYIDGAEEDSVALGGSTVPDNANDWMALSSYGIAYASAFNITIGGNLRQQIVWEYDTTFTDGSGNGNDATPTFRTTSSDADVIGTLTSFLPVSEAQAPSYSLTVAPDLITTAPNVTGNFSTTVAPTLPGADVITDVAAAGQVPSQLPWHIISGFVILIASLVVSWLMRHYGSNSVMIKCFVIGIAMAFAVGVQLYDFWMLIFFVIISVALLMASRQQTWT